MRTVKEGLAKLQRDSEEGVRTGHHDEQQRRLQKLRQEEGVRFTQGLTRRLITANGLS